MKILAESGQNAVVAAEAIAAAQQAQVDPGGQSFVEPVLAPPGATGRRNVDVTEVGDPNGRGIRRVNGTAPSRLESRIA